MTKNIAKKIIIFILISIIVEICIMSYNFLVNKIFEKLHLIGNESIVIDKDMLEITEENDEIFVKANNVEENIYNVCLVMDGKNGDAYMRLIMNNDATFIPKENEEGTKYKVYFFNGIKSNDNTFSITFPKQALDINNIKQVVINENTDYLPNIAFSVKQVIAIFLIEVASYAIIILFKVIKNKEINIKKENIFAIIAGVAGVILLFASAPQARYDEHAHFWRAYEISEGYIISKIDHELPTSIINLFRKDDGSYPNHNFDYSQLKEQLGVSLDKTTKEVFPVGASGGLTIVSYIPQLVGTIIGKIINISPLGMLWMGRLTNLIAYIILVYLAIRLMPSEKWKNILIVVALFPMSINLAASYSPDTVINGVTFLAIAYTMHLKFKKEKIDWKDTILLGILYTIPTICKIVYAPLIALFFIIPSEKFKNKKQYIYNFLICVAIMCCTYKGFGILKAMGTYPSGISTNTTEQVLFTMSDIIRDLKVAISTIFNNSSTYLFEMIGGWNTIQIVSVFIFVILCVVTFEKNEKSEQYILDKKDYFIIWGITIVEIVAIFAGLYLTWSRGRTEIVEGVQGRYFIPIIPLLLIAVSKNKIEVKIKNRGIKYIIFMMLMYLLVIAYTIKEYI